MQEFEPSPAMPAAHPIPQQRVAIRETGRPARPLANAASTHTSPTAEPQSASANAARAVMSPPIIPPRPVAGMETNRAPAYPEIARRRGEQGNVMLRVNVSADGAPLAVDLAATSGYPSLDAAAQSAVRQWRFVPATQGGISIAAVAEIPVRFRLDN
jgi:protein TonB